MIHLCRLSTMTVAYNEVVWCTRAYKNKANKSSKNKAK